MRTTVEKGREAEDIAALFLEERGLVVLDRNYRFMKAEVDIVAIQDQEVVFVEVRSLKNTRFGHPEETITELKKNLLYQAADAWLYERRMGGARMRFDVVSIVYENEEHKPEIEYFRNAFWPG
jgi:putative endonuclease